MTTISAANLPPMLPRISDGRDYLNVSITGTSLAPLLLRELSTAKGIRASVVDFPLSNDADVLVGFNFPPSTLAGLHRLRWVHLTGTGTDHLVATGLREDVLVTSSAKAPAAAVAEYAIAGLMLLTKELPEVVMRDSPTWFASNARMLAGSAPAVIGAGRIGRAVLQRLTALGALPIAVTRTGRSAVKEATRTVSVTQFVREAPGCDSLIVCLPGGDETRGLISAEVLAALPRHASIVNVGRAETIDNRSLFRALHEGRLNGAFVDVHEYEPIPEDDSIWQVPRLVISPHRAFAFPEEHVEVARTFLANLDDLRQSRLPRDLVTRWSGSSRRSGG